MDDKDRPVSWWVDEKVRRGVWCEEEIPPALTGLSRPITVLRAQRAKRDIIVHSDFGRDGTFCPGTWHDLAIGSGACNMACRACFLLLTHRALRDPHRHVLYDNLGDYAAAVAAWLQAAERRPADTLGIGIDRSDSLLYEGTAPHVRNLAPLFGDPQVNLRGCRMVLLTKSANVRFLGEVAEKNRPFIIMTFSVNPQGIADLWEGQYPDGERIPPAMQTRLEAAKYAQGLGYEIRLRVDPILWPADWQEQYADFVAQVQAVGLVPALWTLGSYREKNAQLDTWREKWGLPPLGWTPPREDFVRDGTHFRVPAEVRVSLYAQVAALIHDSFPGAEVGLCKETHQVRKAAGRAGTRCNCLR